MKVKEVENNINNKEGENQNKTTIFLDIDDVIFNSSEVVVDILNKRHNLSKTTKDIKDWGYKSIYSKMTPELIEDIFESKEFWEKIKIDKDFISKICKNKKIWEGYKWAFVTQGSDTNIENKINFFTSNKEFKRYFDNITFYGLGIQESKNIINMINGIQIDDNFKNLKNTNANLKILFKNDRNTNYNTYEIQKELCNREDLYTINTFKELEDILLFNLEYSNF